ncbi:MAG: ABC transporter substrate-binding protein [Flavobacteriales bacterium]|nr:ABC transporter substrate-binding protein [Flavobacteriia bacterium]NCP06298.1 ABC transporter substrate-binding protein [Flavobacteriales bacterium]PIV95148.1 MAG: ABC transporter substrate-binding protein [Flavobacteriaceae bacterium CG17_big_fil_post_rev_8_21_14_2_50_33_15]PIY13411.1 MAG: ABC transporter substrate-binding protein [Flavobacteriaceae bacterium CG_4_10_14_3_um_filter_33_47]NCP61138.1 ABC transporter substrate-binding protein [Flavobacteriales bacterium]
MLRNHIHSINLTKGIFIVIINLLIFSCKDSLQKSTDNLVFRYNEHKNISSLDPAFSKDLADIWATNQLFNGLVQMDDKMQVLPSIAKDWTISEDALTYTFILRKDIFFHKHKLFGKDSTRTVKASDFEYSLNRLKDSKIASPGRWVLNKVERYQAINDTLFEIHLQQPFPAFLGLLSMKYCSVVPKEIVEHYGSDFRANPIGTGPFKFKRWEENIKLVFRKNESYFETDEENKRLPYLEAIAITFLPDKQSEFLQFAQGNIDYISGLDASYKDEILTASGHLRAVYDKDVNMIRGPYLNTEYLAFYMDSEIPEIQSELIRKAVNYGFDRQKMMVYLRNGIGIPAYGGFIPKGLPGYNETIGYTYQPEKSKQLISQFKTETGIENPEITITTTSNYLSFCEYIQREIQKTGLQVKIDVIPAATLKDAKANGKLDMFRASWVADYPDAENYLSLYFSKNFAPNGPNYTHFNNKQFDTWFEEAFIETNTKKREQLYAKMDSLVMQQAPVVVMFYDEVVRFTRKNVRGLGINPINLLELKRVKKD